MNSITRTLINSMSQPVLILSAILLNGCLNLDQTLTIQKDGSAILDVTYSLTENSIIQAKAMLKLKEQINTYSANTKPNPVQDTYVRLLLDPVQDSIRKELDSYKPYGITVKHLRVETRREFRYVSIRLAIDDLGKATKTDLFRVCGFSLTKTTNDNYRFLLPRSTVQLESSSLNESDIRMLSPILNGFHVQIKLVTPSQILKTNAHKSSENTAEWVFDFDDNPNAIVALQNQNFDVLFAGPGVHLPQIVMQPQQP